MRATDAVVAYMTSLAQRKFWGFITVKFENGCPVHVRREENLKPGDLPIVVPETNRSYEHDCTAHK